MIVTIVTPTLNGVQYLRECIESARRNETADIRIEHVIVDGGSNDGTVELARSYGLTVLTGKDKGIFDAINKGSFNSSGELLGFLGADDVMLDGTMQEVVDIWRRSGRRWVVGGIQWIDERGKSLGKLAAPPHWMTPRMLVCMRWNPIMHMATYFSREFFAELGGFDIAYKDAGDYEMFSRALMRAPYARLKLSVSCFRRTGVNNSAVQGERTARETALIRATFGPSWRLEQRLWEVALRLWFNLANPRWLLRKLVGRARVRAGTQATAHF